MLDEPVIIPDDPEELRSFTARLLDEVKAQAVLIEKLRHQLAGHRAHRFGSSSESIEQLQLALETSEIAAAAMTARMKLPDIEAFEPERLAGRILGMGDMLTLIERAQDSISEDEAASMQRKLDEGQFDFEDFLDQLRQVKKLGPLTDILSMLPGANRMMKDVDPNMAEDSLKRTEAIINSMTAQERRSPDILNGSRRRRIATGSGTTVQDVNTLIKQFREMQKMMKQMGIMGGGKKGKGGRRARGAMSDVMKMFNMN